MNEILRKTITELGVAGVRWIVTSGVSLILILAATLVVLRIYRMGARRLESWMMARTAAREVTEDPAEAKKRISTLSGMIRKVGAVAIWVMAAMIALRSIGVDIGPLIAGAGILGLAVGFGAQSLVKDVISGFFILFENQIRVGDVAVINGTGGLVESINIRTVVLRDLSGVVHVFPNGSVTTLANMTKDWSAMIFDIGVAYKEDTDRVVEIMKKVADELRQDEDFGGKIVEPLEVLGVDNFGDSAVVIKARQKTRPIQQWAVGREYRRRLKKAFDAEGIEIPFPHRTLYWGEASKAIEVLTNRAGSGRAADDGR